MSTVNPDSNQSCCYDSESTVDSVNNFVQAVVDGFNEVGASEEVVEEIEQKGQQLTEEVDQLADQVDDNTETIDDERERRSAEVEGCHSRITRVSNEIEAVGADSEDTNPTPNDGKTTIQTPIERVCRLDQELVGEELTNNQRRARFVAKDIADYGRKVPAGIAIKSSEIRRVLSAASENTTIYSQTVSRVMDFLDRLGNDDVSIKTTQSGERTVVFSEEIVERLGQITNDVTDNNRGAVTEAVV